MNGLPIEVIVVLVGIGAVAFGWLLLRFGRTLARIALVAGGLALAIIVSLAMLDQATATREAAEAVKVASVGQATTSAGAMMCVGGMGVLSLVAAGAAGVFYVKLRLANHASRRRALPQRQRERGLPSPAQPVVYYVEEAEPVDDLVNLWGWQ